MSDQRKIVLDGVTRALAEVGEDLTVKRVTTVPNPSNPTLPGTSVTESHTCRGYIYPLEKWDPLTMTRNTTTMVIMDSQSFVPAFVPERGDVVVDERGKEYRLLDRQNPRLLGDDMAFIHPVGSV
ncbi:hypothetical protein SP069_00220 [Salmonella phage SP069]|uniref:Uncharacterized protein n=2 Tax=Nonanavirus TaxID=1921122 RepID=S4TU89_9CAUD|nr:hypothetical protein QII00_sAgp44 [Salmonella phage SP069]AGF89324.1 hypothetical protein SP062_00220 [Salmonella phage FSL SP-062]AGF89543.1 hypothetical protein SP069_00220 [Salmonella phage SP069]